MDPPSPISVMSEGQENFYNALENALGGTEDPQNAKINKKKREESSHQNIVVTNGVIAENNQEDLNTAMALNQSEMTTEMLDYLKSQLSDRQKSLVSKIQNDLVQQIVPKLE